METHEALATIDTSKDAEVRRRLFGIGLIFKESELVSGSDEV